MAPNWFGHLQENAAVRSYHTVIINTVVGGVAFLIVSGCLICHIVRIAFTIRAKKVW
jgi:hypothetical protein